MAAPESHRWADAQRVLSECHVALHTPHGSDWRIHRRLALRRCFRSLLYAVAWTASSLWVGRRPCTSSHIHFALDRVRRAIRNRVLVAARFPLDLPGVPAGSLLCQPWSLLLDAAASRCLHRADPCRDSHSSHRRAPPRRQRGLLSLHSVLPGLGGNLLLWQPLLRLSYPDVHFRFGHGSAASGQQFRKFSHRRSRIVRSLGVLCTMES